MCACAMTGQERHRRKPALGLADGHEGWMGTNVGWRQGLGRQLGMERRLGWRQGHVGRWWQGWPQGRHDGCWTLRRKRWRKGHVVNGGGPSSFYIERRQWSPWHSMQPYNSEGADLGDPVQVCGGTWIRLLSACASQYGPEPVHQLRLQQL